MLFDKVKESDREEDDDEEEKLSIIEVEGKESEQMNDSLVNEDEY